ncbi:KEOPS complex subunit Pcc1 [Natranaeroarchaeum sulfidigenes]|uniref:Subunit of KEOPS complex (Cgi121BUD32KAE1) n=1 Tax=Natranaeroarchaeum sulfidigenes TaxID=2784880 RepID=A0A897MS11_9EURY|nr:KEOPS complex subunit Pcc1 [Natranaeroarchaeum sulfidigenes]QSG03232.1 Subunit of KEOPS complex (Cgi121BUD32KAE1) [Natranaeroarchaeum sulfidigenes]
MKRATIRTRSEHAETIARAIRPDNTDEMVTHVENADDADRVRTTIERETTGGLQTNVDDYVVNVDVATQVVEHANQHTNTQP